MGGSDVAGGDAVGTGVGGKVVGVDVGVGVGVGVWVGVGVAVAGVVGDGAAVATAPPLHTSPLRAKAAGTGLSVL